VVLGVIGSRLTDLVLLRGVDYTEDKLIFGKTRLWRMFSVRHTFFDGEYVCITKIELPICKISVGFWGRNRTWFLTVILIFYMM
jgi:hypothetical protein